MTNLQKRWIEVQLYVLADKCMNSNPLKGVTFNTTTMFRRLIETAAYGAGLSTMQSDAAMSIAYNLKTKRAARPSKAEIVLLSNIIGVAPHLIQKALPLTPNWYYHLLKKAKKELGENGEGIAPKAFLTDDEYALMEEILKSLNNIKEVSRIVTNN